MHVSCFRFWLFQARAISTSTIPHIMFGTGTRILKFRPRNSSLLIPECAADKAWIRINLNWGTAFSTASDLCMGLTKTIALFHTICMTFSRFIAISALTVSFSPRTGMVWISSCSSSCLVSRLCAPPNVATANHRQANVTICPEYIKTNNTEQYSVYVLQG